MSFKKAAEVKITLDHENHEYSRVQNGVPNFEPFFWTSTMPPPLSTSVRQLIWFYFESGKDDKHILDVTEISVRQLRKMRRNWGGS